jgi:hypothetical protein
MGEVVNAPPGDVLLENLERWHLEAVKAVEREQRQIEECIRLGRSSSQIAAAIQCTPNNVRNLKVWRERQR